MLRKLLILGSDKSQNLVTLSQQYLGKDFKDLETIKDDVQEVIFQSGCKDPQPITEDQRMSLQLIYKFLNGLERMKNNNPPIGSS